MVVLANSGSFDHIRVHDHQVNPISRDISFGRFYGILDPTFWSSLAVLLSEADSKIRFGIDRRHFAPIHL